MRTGSHFIILFYIAGLSKILKGVSIPFIPQNNKKAKFMIP